VEVEATILTGEMNKNYNNGYLGWLGKLKVEEM